ncbi:class I SAM-dependent methyltransferase [Adhaeribacter radiodurans]|uniref:Class I SAM-dependent methyltransferase n=1 Tax=Adhaeribacter radiodurans TaxID=2745197 RepID=A0A7L7L3Y3_9BACT|nr:class I SAM-dependent methyltransferase [Adhaeribacter radiodurans]QMU27295.1 class I SAM-dependent methyltransferase [Adhaeribacter radiodurans]
MKQAKNLFSNQAKEYKRFRPTYPKALYQRILQEVKDKDHAWDCGTGNGQVPTELAKHFTTVTATDISQSQLDQAEPSSNITYQICRAEQTNFSNDSFDLITVAQAIHWFDFKAFYQEVTRVSRPNGLLAVWGYGLLQFEDKVNPLISHFYRDVTGPYWDTERHYIDEAYQTIPFEFPEIAVEEHFAIKQDFTLTELGGYLNTWSSIQKYQKVNNSNPIKELLSSLETYWPENTRKTATFPIFMRLGRILK